MHTFWKAKQLHIHISIQIMQIKFMGAISEENLFILKDFIVLHYLTLQIYDLNTQFQIKSYLFLVKSSKSNI